MQSPEGRQPRALLVERTQAEQGQEMSGSRRGGNDGSRELFARRSCLATQGSVCGLAASIALAPDEQGWWRAGTIHSGVHRARGTRPTSPWSEAFSPRPEMTGGLQLGAYGPERCPRKCASRLLVAERSTGYSTRSTPRTRSIKAAGSSGSWSPRQATC